MAAKKAKFERILLVLNINFYILFALLCVIFRSMSKQTKGFQGIRNNIFFYLPFTWYFVVFAVCCIAGYKWLSTQPNLPDTAYADIFPLLIHIAVFFVLVMLSISLLSVLISFLFFLVKKNRGAITFKIATKALQTKRGEQKQAVQLDIHPILKPFLGFVKIRLK